MEIKNIEHIAKQIAERLKPLNPVKIILFGSYAEGTYTQNSDLDICIVKEEVNSKISDRRKARKLLQDIHIAKDILISTRKEYDFYKNEFGSVFMDIDKKGKILWSAI